MYDRFVCVAIYASLVKTSHLQANEKRDDKINKHKNKKKHTHKNISHNFMVLFLFYRFISEKKEGIFIVSWYVYDVVYPSLFRTLQHMNYIEKILSLLSKNK